MLNKEFQKKDVQRLRNIVQGKYGDKTVVGVGYTKKYEHHVEGDARGVGQAVHHHAE